MRNSHRAISAEGLVLPIGGDHLLLGGVGCKSSWGGGGGVIDAGSKISMSTNAETDEASLPERILILSPFPRAAIFLSV